jgi:hypothetical protein
VADLGITAGDSEELEGAAGSHIVQSAYQKSYCKDWEDEEPGK